MPQTFFVNAPDQSVSGSNGNDTILLNAISTSFPRVALALLDGLSGIDILDASNVFVGNSFMQFADNTFVDRVSGVENVFSVGNFDVTGVEVIFGNSSSSNHFLLQRMHHSMTMHGGGADDKFTGTFDYVDVMFGYGGNDYFNVRPNDRAYGGAGNDVFDLNETSQDVSGSEVVGGDGIDSLDLGFGWTVDLAAGWANSPFAGDRDTYHFSSIEYVEVYAWRGYATSVLGSSEANRFSVNPTFSDGSVGVLFSGVVGDDTLDGSLGNDTLNGGADNDILNGHDGSDTLRGNDGDDTVIGGAGSDVINGGKQHDLLEGAAGNDTIDGANGRDTLSGGEGEDSVLGGNSNDSIVGGLGNDILKGGRGKDILNGQEGNDILTGGSQDDTLLGGNGRDTLLGHNGFDLLDGEAGNDKIDGGNAGDTIRGGGGMDTLFGGSGKDSIDGGSHDDKIDGESGNDTLIGGTGYDTFVFGGNWDADLIVDFSAEDAEKIDLSATGIADFTDMITNHIRDNGGNAEIYHGSGNSILLQGVTVAQIGTGLAYSEGDFIF